ncbi:MAG: FkbM family methyltransferase [Candidatus Aminicenantes bacterium]|nr:MAG: FkbM family methyltransferase [Candidatus Aminicenantes bacterium]
MYEVRLVKALSSLLPQDGVVLDIGANIGTITLPLAARCPSGIVYAFEPVTSTRRFLERNTSSMENIKVQSLGLGDANGPKKIHIHPRNPGGAHTGGDAEEEEISETIEIMTLDTWVSVNKIERIDMIKLDIEGDELAFLAGASETLRRFRPVLALECNPIPLWRFAKAGPSALIESLATIYDSVGWIDEDGTIRRLENIDQALSQLSHHALIDLICGGPFAADLKLSPKSSPRAGGKSPSRLSFMRRLAHHGIQAFAKAMAVELEKLQQDISTKKPPPTPEFTYVHSPSYSVVFEINQIKVPAGSFLYLPVRFHNTSSFWYWSHWPNPVTATYRWRQGGRVVINDGLRTLLHDPIAPGAQVVINLAVSIPEKPGDYELVFCLVQEGYAWFDQLRPELGVVLPVQVGK